MPFSIQIPNVYLFSDFEGHKRCVMRVIIKFHEFIYFKMSAVGLVKMGFQLLKAYFRENSRRLTRHAYVCDNGLDVST
jgi:hypothetical protein